MRAFVLTIANVLLYLHVFPFWFWGRDVRSNCISSWSLSNKNIYDIRILIDQCDVEWTSLSRQWSTKNISICVAAITLQIFTIFSYITGTSMPSQAPPVSFRESSLIWSLSKFIFLGKDVYFTPVNRNKQIFKHENCILDLKQPIFFFIWVLLVALNATSAFITFVNVKSSEEYVVWQNFMPMRASVAQLDARPSGDQEVAGSSPTEVGNFFRGDWSWNIFYGHSLPSADSRRAVVSFWRKNVHNTG